MEKGGGISMEILISVGLAIVWILCLAGICAFIAWLMHKYPVFSMIVSGIVIISSFTLIVYYTLFR